MSKLPIITDARIGSSVDTSSRTRRYVATMLLRTVCFLVAAIWAHGWLQWALFAGAVFLPYLAVLVANQVDNRGLNRPARPIDPDVKQLTQQADDDVVEGVVLDDASSWAGTR